MAKAQRRGDKEAKKPKTLKEPDPAQAALSRCVPETAAPTPKLKTS